AEGMISPNMCVMISQDLGARARIGYVRPLSLADPRLADNGLFNFRKPLHAGCDTVLYNQATLPGRIRLYAFKDTARAKLERENYVSLAMYNRDFDRTVYAEQEAFFGVTAFECDTDLDAETVFAWSRNRQTMAMVLRRFTNRDFLELDGPKRAARQGKRRRGRPPQAARATGPAELVDEEYDEEDLAADRVRGLEFVNFLAARAVCCMMFRASAAGLLEKRSWGELMDDLATSWRMSDDTGELPVLGDKGWAHTLPPVLDLIERLGLAALSEEDLPKKRGRPRTRPPRRKKLSPGAQAAADAEAKAAAADALAAARDALWAGPKAQEMAEARAAARAAAREGRNAQDAKDARDLKEAK
ncbi:MAG: hypothetical protein Q4F72_08660, partial [Desulfovibrionaceae bacterium]|nr:hypothetical protein [Desulfovibrionaceae bacterium]